DNFPPAAPWRRYAAHRWTFHVIRVVSHVPSSCLRGLWRTKPCEARARVMRNDLFVKVNGLRPRGLRRHGCAPKTKEPESSRPLMTASAALAHSGGTPATRAALPRRQKETYSREAREVRFQHAFA